MFAELLERVRPHRTIAAPVLPLADALEKLDITVFSSSSVEEYKTAEAEGQFIEAIPPWIRYQGWVVTADLSPFMGWVGRRMALKDRKEGWDVRMVFNGGLPNVANPTGLSQAYLVKVRWTRFTLSSADLADPAMIPAFVRRKADMISQAVPGATFEMDKLQRGVVDCDPFLVVKYGQEEYYVEVWGNDDVRFVR